MEPQALNILSTITAVIAALGTVVSGIVALVVLRIQRDMAQLENRVLAAINGKYISRREHDVICANHEAAIEAIRESATDARRRHHNLNEEFIECRAAHGDSK